MRIRRLVSSIALAALAIAGLILVFTLNDGNTGTGSGGAGGAIQLNEVMTGNKGAVPDINGNFPDWIELYNKTESDMDISGYGLSDDKLVVAKWVLPRGTMIPAKGYLVIFCSGNADDGPLYANFRLSSTDELLLTNTLGQAVDSLALRSVGNNATLARNDAGNWAEMGSPSPGYPNTEAGAAAYRESMQVNVIDNGVRINEFMASNATTLPGLHGDYADWIELYNTTSEEVDVSGCGLSDTMGRPMKWIFPEGTKIPPNGHLLVYCSGRDGLIDGELHAPFGLRAYQEDVVLAGPNGAIIDSYSYDTQETDISMARIPDGTGGFQSTAQPSPGHPNNEAGFAAHTAMHALPRGELYISEASLNNVAALAFEDTTPDWIELFNGTGAPVNLSGYALTDNPKNPAKWVFPDTTMEPGEYKLILATGNDSKDTQKKNLETNFGIAGDGEVLLLFSPQGELLDKLQLKNAGPDISYGRVNKELRYFDAPTPGAANEGGYMGFAQRPAFSITPGIYDGPMQLALTAEPGARVHYTTDCTLPTANSPQYAGPLSIDKNTVVRAIAIQDGYLSAPAATGTFLLRTDQVNHSLPVAALVFEPEDLWDKKKGIYAFGEKYDPDLPMDQMLLNSNFYQGRGNQGETVQTQWERMASFSIFDEETNLEIFSQDIGARIAGAFGRSRAQKGFNLIARAEYGANRMEYPFFENRSFTEYKSLVLRAGAQDQNRGKIRDELATGLLEGTNVDFLYQSYKPYVLYLNGEYWGVYFLKDKRSRFFVAAHEGVEDAKNLDLLKASTQISHGSNEEWLALTQYVKTHDLSNGENYKYVEERMDVNSFMDYMACEIYTGNSDYANIQYYKLPGGKWRWVYYDFCWGFSSVSHKTLSLRRGSQPAASDLFNALLKNSGWRDAFIRRYAELQNTVFTEERINALVDELYAIVEPEIEREREKFNQAIFMGTRQKNEVLGTYESFIKEIADIRRFAKERPEEMKRQFKAEFSLTDSYMQEVFG